jgi:HD-like signal output (HDOD) protein
MQSAQELVAGTVKLVTLPAVYLRVRHVVADPSTTLHDLTESVSADPGLSLRFLRIVNSAYFGLPRQVHTISHALSLLGMQQVHDIVLAASVATAFSGIEARQMSVSRFWFKCAKRGGSTDSERLFVLGLLSEIGHLVMYQRVPAQALEAIQRSADAARPLYACERDLIGCDYGQVGAALIGAWNLPAAFAAAIVGQTEPILSGDAGFESAVLHVAAHIGDSIADLPPKPTLHPIHPDALAFVHLSDDDLEDVRQHVAAHVTETTELFFPGSTSTGK